MNTITVPPEEVWVPCPLRCGGRVRVRGVKKDTIPVPYCAGCSTEFRAVEPPPEPILPTLRVRPDGPRRITCPVRGCDGEVGLRDGKTGAIRQSTWCTTCKGRFNVLAVPCQQRLLTVVGGKNLLVKKEGEIRGLD